MNPRNQIRTRSYRPVLIRAAATGILMLASLLAMAAAFAQDQPVRKPDVPFVPTPPEVVERMLDLAKVGKNDVVYDLGCGDGRIVITAAKERSPATSPTSDLPAST